MKHNYKDDMTSKLYENRAKTLLKHLKGQGEVELDQVEKAWKLSTMLPITDEDLFFVNVIFLEGAIGVEVNFILPDILNNDIFKQKLISRDTDILINGKYPSRTFLIDLEDGLTALFTQIAYLFDKELDEEYDINEVVDILIYVGTKMRTELSEYIESVSLIKNC